MRAAILLAAALCCAALAQAQERAPEPEIVAPPPAPADAAPRIIAAPSPAPTRRPRRAQTAQPGGEPDTDFPAAIAQETFAATSSYQGAEVTVFGYTPDRMRRGDVVVAVRGPPQTAVVRRKFRFLAFWVNGDPVRFEDAPSFLAVYSTRPLREIASPRAIWELRLDPAASARLVGATPADADASAYRRALVRLRRQSGLYVEEPEGLELDANALFHRQIKIPASAPLGEYTIEIFWFRDNRLIARQENTLNVARQGIERTIHDLATTQGFFYGILAVMLALGGGWASAMIFRKT
ncbi:MAG: hypothetical protein GC206_00020 [Alphaproteobacteria bacterium]|nr:hypothetical protein [Alphaproteobacteria bacterium]